MAIPLDDIEILRVIDDAEQRNDPGPIMNGTAIMQTVAAAHEILPEPIDFRPFARELDNLREAGWIRFRVPYGWVAAKRVVMALAAVEQGLYESGIDIPEIPTTLTLEHILPQSWEENWPLPADIDPAEALTRRESHLHRLGNLTLVVGGLNTELSNAAWPVKQHKLNTKTKLLLNVELLQAYPDAFDEDAIDERGRLLAQRICRIWPDAEHWRSGDVAATESGPPLEIEEVIEPESEQVEAELEEARPATLGEVPLLERFTAALAEAAPSGTVDIAHERGTGSRARLELAGATTVKFAYVDESLPSEVPLWLYPADTLEQARQLYGDPGRCEELLALRDQGWEIEPNFHWGFMARGLSWTRSRLSTDEYVAYWIEHIRTTNLLTRDDWHAELQRLIDDGIVDADDLPQFEADFTNTERGSASPRPGLSVLRRWPLQALDDVDFPGQIAEALRAALTALGEPLRGRGTASSSTSPPSSATSSRSSRVSRSANSSGRQASRFAMCR